MGENLSSSQQGGRFPGRELGGVRSYPSACSPPGTARAGGEGRTGSGWVGSGRVEGSSRGGNVASFSLLALVNPAPPFCTLVYSCHGSAFRVSSSFLPPARGLGAHTPWDKLSGPFRLFFHVGRSGNRGNENTRHSLQALPPPATSCPSAHLTRGDTAGHQTGKSRWAVVRSWKPADTTLQSHRGKVTFPPPPPSLRKGVRSVSGGRLVQQQARCKRPRHPSPQVRPGT